jgi:hypothetical protein
MFVQNEIYLSFFKCLEFFKFIESSKKQNIKISLYKRLQNQIRYVGNKNGCSPDTRYIIINPKFKF